jgi:hypothetical protein
MGSLSKGYAYDAGKRDPKVPRTVYVKGERRSEKYPSGVMDRFVNLQGNVVQCQLLSPGLARSPDAIARARSQLHQAKNADGSVKGFVEHDRCPLRHAANLRSTTAEEEFAAMPAELHRPCNEDPTVVTKGKKGREYHDPCPHIQWLIESRRTREAERRSARSGRTENVLEMERRKLEIAEQSLAEQRRANERMAQAVEQATARPPRKVTPE